MSDAALTAQLNRWQSRALIIGAIAAALSIFGAFSDRAQFYHSYLFAWIFWSGLSLGALVLVMMQFLTGGQWGLALRGLATAAFSTLPMMAVFFLPVLLGLHHIYAWSSDFFGEAGPHTHKQQWLTAQFFIGRSVSYLVVLITLALVLRRWAAAQTVSNSVPTKITALSSGGLIAYVICMNFASTDWIMSLTPEWYSTMFVIIFAAGQFLGALALMTALLVAFSRHHSLGSPIPAKVFNDLGSLLMAFVIFGTYVSFSQFLIIWSGNLPKEIVWYLQRSRGGWQWFAVALLVFQFFLPFALLLSRAAKRNPPRLGFIALGIVAANVLGTFWLIAPTFHPEGIYLHWLDLAEWLALGGFWFALFFYFLKQHPLFPAELMNLSAHE